MKKFKKYKIVLENNFKSGTFKVKKNAGFKVKPKNNVEYEGILVNKLLILKKQFITKLLKKKIKRKLDLYLDIIIDIADYEDESDDGAAFKESLDELTRFKDVVKYKYKKHLDAKYIKLLIKKIELLEYELKERLITNYYESEETKEEEMEETLERHKKR